MSEVVDPRQARFLELYLDPSNPQTYSNIYQSAIEAGYSREYAESFQVKTKKWLSESIGVVTKDKLVSKAKKVLDKSLDSVDEKIAQDTAKFIAKTDKDFSEKQEIDATVDSNLTIQTINYSDANDNDTPQIQA